MTSTLAELAENVPAAMLVLTEEVAKLKAVGALMPETVSHLAEQVRSLSLQPEASSGSGSGGGGRPRLPKPAEPPMFGGEATRVLEWSDKVRLYLSSFPAATELERLNAVGGFLQGDAWDRYNLLRKEFPPDAVQPLTVESLLQDLLVHFADQNLADKNRWALDHAKQLTTESVMQFAMRLDRLVAVPGLEDLRGNSRHMLHVFLSGIGAEVKRMLLPQLRQFETKEQAVIAAIDAEQLLARTRPRDAGPRTQARLRTLEAGLAEVREEAHQASLAMSRADWQKHQASGGQRNAQSNPGRGQAGANKNRRLVPGTDGQTHPGIICYQCHQEGHCKVRCPGRTQPGNG